MLARGFLRTILAVGAVCLVAGGCGSAAETPSSEGRVEAGADLPTAGPAAHSTPGWYVIADGGGGAGGNDQLYSVDITLPVPQNAQSAIGTGTGTDNIEGAAFWPGNDTLYAFDRDRLGTVNLTTGAWTQLVNKDVWDDGNGARLVGLDSARNPETVRPDTLSDIDSVSFDPNTGRGYGVARVGGADILFQFDVATGFIVRGAFQIGATVYDYFRVPAVEPGNEDIDDIAIDPYDGQLYGIANGGGRADRLVRIDKFTGISSDVGVLGVEDMEGFAFYNDSTMWGVSGNTSNNAPDGSSNDDSVFSIDRVAGLAYDRRPLTVGGFDFESMAFLTADLNEFCGRVWCDDNGNAVQDGGELGVPNVTLVLWRDVANNDVLDAETDIALASTTTDAAGDYCFGVASTGDYVITVKSDTLPADFVLSQADVQPVSVTGFGNTVSGLDFVKTGAVGTLGDTIFLDVDGDGVQDITDPGLRDVTVNLVDPGPDGTCGTPDDVVLQTTTTDGGGYYYFASLPDAGYCLDVDESTLPPASTLTTGNEPYAATVAAGSNDLGADFGYQFPARVGDLVWLDVNGDGLVDPDEPGLAGVTVDLSAPGPDGFFGTADDVAVATTVTGAQGAYEFGGLVPGAYAVTVNAATTPTGTTLTTGANPIRGFLRQGQFYELADFGYVGNASIGDRLWNDLDGDGLQEPGEPGLAGVRVTLVGAGTDGILGTADDLHFPAQTTAADGSYSFPGLIPDVYRVDVDTTTLPAGITTPTSGNDPLDITLAQGDDFTDADFGFKQDDATIGDRVWNDLDGDGLDEAGEAGLGGVQLNLLTPGPDGVFGTADDVTAATRTTAADGSYDFTALPAGRYRVDVVEGTLPAGFGLSTGNEPLDVILAGSQDFNDGDFGFWAAASIGDRLWDDLDGDGVQDAGEPGLGGVDVDLLGPGADGTLGTADDVVLLSTTTAADGTYGFAGLAPGPVRVDVDGGTLPAGYVLTSGNEPLDRVLAAGETVTDADFGFWAPASIGDRVFDDLDGDGLQDAGEPGLGGVRVDLTEAGPDGLLGTLDDVVIGSDTSDAAGVYGFGVLPAGLYRVNVDQGTAPAGFMLTTGNDPLDVMLGQGATVTNADFGFWRSASVGDRVWNDVDGDGLQDAGEPGISGVGLDLTEAGPDGTHGTADDVAVASSVTGVDGTYAFGSLPPGNYRIALDAGTVPAGLVVTGGSDPTDFVLNPGDAVTTVDFGLRDSGRLGDLVWDDVDGDGVPDVGEPGLPGVTVRLLDAGPDGMCGSADDVDLGSTTTNAAGNFAFENLPGGTYCVMVDGATVPGGYVPTSGVGTQVVTLPPGGTRDDTDFGYRQVAAIGDRVWHDLNADGVEDPGEPGLVGVDVDLLEAGPDGTLGTPDDITFPTQTTGADGAYLFSSLLAGVYRVTVDGVTLPAGMTLTTANQPYDTTLAPGAGDAGADFGFQYPSVIEGSVWQDVDEDGTVEGGEPGIVAVAVDLFGPGPDGLLGTADDVLVDSQVTSGPAGDYRFEHVPPGMYRVLVRPATVPAGMDLTTGNQPFDTVIPTTPTTARADFGYQHTGTIGDRVYFDLDADGVEDPGELGIVGVQVALREAGPDALLGTADDTVFPNETTAADGTYTFAQLPPGLYRVSPVTATLPAGTALSTANAAFDIPLPAAGTETSADFGYRHTGVIGDRLWRDSNADGVQDPGEPGLDAVGLTLVGPGADGLFGTADDVTLGTTTTAMDGSYGFSNLPAGDYRVVVDTGTLTTGLQPTTGGSQLDVTLTAGEVLSTADFGFQFASSIGDRVWTDDDFDGVQDLGEAGLVGVTVALFEAGVDGLLGTADDVAVGSTTTGADGAYGFAFLPPGLYRVEVPGAGLPAGFQPTTGNLPFDVMLGTAQVVTDADFGYQVTSTLGDRVWNDLDGDGVQDPGEPGLNGVTVTVSAPGPDGLLGTADDVVVGSTVTAGDGDWTVPGLPPGPYRVIPEAGTLPAGMQNTTANVPLDVTLPVATTLDTIDMGFQFTGAIGDRVWTDTDADGVQDVGEVGLVGVQVDLIEAGPDAMLGTADDVNVGSTLTGVDGAYTFAALPPGLY
ncbi:MAG: SdrD B-like domain-containing protein, partial [Planctomycetota bacterium]|nr:SdrD B-like domain-containing protein [Planctomycetota bacterium]